ARLQGIAILEKELANVKLPDISGDSRIKILGKVRYEISRLDLTGFRLPLSRISLVPNVGLQVSITNAFTKVKGNWRVKLRFIRDHGSFDVTVENINININVRLGKDTAGKPTVDTSHCSTRISTVRVHFSGRLGWLYNLFHKVIESKLRKILEGKVCELQKLGEGNLHPEFLCHVALVHVFVPCFTVTTKIDAITGLDYSLVEPPTATAQSLDVAMKGEFFSMANRSAVPFAPLPLTLPLAQNRMIYFGASSYFFNTASFAYHEAGALVFEITDSMVTSPKNGDLCHCPYHLPAPLQLEEIYPDLRMKFRLFTPSAPFLSITPGGFLLKPVVDMQAYAILPNSSLVPLFLVSLVSNVSAVINVKSCHVVGTLKMGR
ncbi:BPI protein, partial [Rostratula benghalensis]|nr:BPI protein [Rostratula benghalensis]